MPYFEKTRDPKPAFVTGGRETRGEVDFDEASWPPAPVYREPYAEALARGRGRMARSRVAITGLVRDSEACLPLNLARLQKLGSLFADYRIILFENDSVDSTPKLLAEASRRNPRLIAVSETLGQKRWDSVRNPQRAAEMAHYRSRCQALIAEACAGFDLVVVADLDLEGWSYDGIANTLGHDGWDAVSSSGIVFRNGRPMFFDGWAFRTLGDAPARRHALGTMVFPRGTPPIRVASAFSGLALYRMEAFAAGRYGGEDCEHVVFHESMAKAGFGRFFLNPSMISLYPDVEVDIVDRADADPDLADHADADPDLADRADADRTRSEPS